MANTLTEIGIKKISERFAESIDHVAYTVDEIPKTIEPFRKIAQDGIVEIYVYFEDTISGTVANVQLVDKESDVVARSNQSFIKSLTDGLYVAFKYNIIEKEVEATSGKL